MQLPIFLLYGTRCGILLQLGIECLVERGTECMCGIAGFCNLNCDREKNISKMMKRMYHRGPDAGGKYTSDDGQVVLGHRRRSIIDLSENGAQPMESEI